MIKRYTNRRTLYFTPTSQTDRQDRTIRTGQDNGPIAQGKPFYKWLPNYIVIKGSITP